MKPYGSLLRRFLVVAFCWMLLLTGRGAADISSISAQSSTTGTSTTTLAAPGYLLVSPLFVTQTYLMNNQGEIVHQWDLDHESGGAAYLLENGSLLQTGAIDQSDVFIEAVRTGGGGYIDLYDWDGELVWEYTLHTNRLLEHHDLAPMPSGNIMLITYERFLKDEAIAAGRDPDLIPAGRDEIWSEALFEIDPDTNEIVWEWHVWDHLIQDFDDEVANYGDPADHPELIDINYVVNFPNFEENYGLSVEWLHANAVDYNQELDQILFNPRQFNEFWIIDHSTTTDEAADHVGGSYGSGGDLLFRWGNPAAYRAGDEVDQILWFHHDPRWVDDGLPGAGNITIFDNGSYVGRATSRALEIAPAIMEDGAYDLSAGQAASSEIVWEYVLSSEFSFIVGAVQRQPNGNSLIADGFRSRLLEVTPDGEVVWEWSEPNTQYLFRVDRYPPDYPAFAGKVLGSG